MRANGFDDLKNNIGHPLANRSESMKTIKSFTNEIKPRHIDLLNTNFERKDNIAYKKSKNHSKNQVNTLTSQFNKSLTSLTGSFELNGLVSTYIVLYIHLETLGTKFLYTL